MVSAADVDPEDTRCKPKEDEVKTIGPRTFPVCKVHEVPMNQTGSACIPGLQEAAREEEA